MLCGDGGLRFVDVVASTLCYEVCPPAKGAKFLKMSLAADGNHVALISDIDQVRFSLTLQRVEWVHIDVSIPMVSLKASCDWGQMFVYDLRSVRNRAAEYNLPFLRKTAARDATVDSLWLTNCRKSASKKPASHGTTSQCSDVSCTGMCHQN